MSEQNTNDENDLGIEEEEKDEFRLHLCKMDKKGLDLFRSVISLLDKLGCELITIDFGRGELSIGYNEHGVYTYTTMKKGFFNSYDIINPVQFTVSTEDLVKAIKRSGNELTTLFQYSPKTIKFFVNYFKNDILLTTYTLRTHVKDEETYVTNDYVEGIDKVKMDINLKTALDVNTIRDFLFDQEIVLTKNENKAVELSVKEVGGLKSLIIETYNINDNDVTAKTILNTNNYPSINEINGQSKKSVLHDYLVLKSFLEIDKHLKTVELSFQDGQDALKLVFNFAEKQQATLTALIIAVNPADLDEEEGGEGKKNTNEDGQKKKNINTTTNTEEPNEDPEPKEG